jgi:hypothetical protein
MTKLLIPLALAAIAASPAADRNKAPDATPIGKPAECIPLNQIEQSHVRNDSVIDFEMAGGKVYRNTLPDPCPELGFEQRFGYATSLDELCSTDIITVLHDPPAPRGASCGLGQFQPVILAKH